MHRTALIPMALVVALAVSGPLPARAAPDVWFEQRDYGAIAEWLSGREADSSEARYWQARLDLVEGRGEAALELTEALVDEDPESARFHSLHGEALAVSLDGAGTFRQMRTARHIRRAYETAVELDPEFLDAHFGLLVYALLAPGIAGGGAERARERAERIAAVSPARGEQARAMILASQGDIDGELEALQAALELDPDLHDARFRAGLLSTHLEDFDQARAQFTTLVEQLPLHFGAWYQLGRVAALSGEQLDAGRAALERFLDSEPRPGNPPPAAAHWRLGMIEAMAGRPEAARAAFERAIELDPDFEEARRALAGLDRQADSG